MTRRQVVPEENFLDLMIAADKWHESLAQALFQVRRPLYCTDANVQLGRVTLGIHRLPDLVAVWKFRDNFVPL